MTCSGSPAWCICVRSTLLTLCVQINVCGQVHSTVHTPLWELHTCNVQVCTNTTMATVHTVHCVYTHGSYWKHRSIGTGSLSKVCSWIQVAVPITCISLRSSILRADIVTYFFTVDAHFRNNIAITSWVTSLHAWCYFSESGGIVEGDSPLRR